MAAVAALVMVREWPYGLREQVAPLPRGRSSNFHILVVLYLQGLAAMILALIVGIVLCTSYGAPIETATLPWQLFTGPAALLAAILLGMAIGALFGEILIIPLLGFGVFMAQQIFFWKGYPELFTTEIPTWFYEDARPIAAQLKATIALNLVTAAGLWFFLDWITRLQGMRPRVLLIACVACLAAGLAIYIPWVASGNIDTYERFR